MNLPKDVLVLTLSKLDLISLSKICQTNQQIRHICNDQQFWKYKYLNEYGMDLPNLNPKTEYLNRRREELKKIIKQRRAEVESEIYNFLMSISFDEYSDTMKGITRVIIRALDRITNEYLKYKDFVMKTHLYPTIEYFITNGQFEINTNSEFFNSIQDKSALKKIIIDEISRLLDKYLYLFHELLSINILIPE